jgi:hypothetical protein
LPESPVFSVTPGCVPLPTFRLARYSCIFRVTDDGSSVNRRIQVYFANVDWRERNATPGYTQYR